MHRLPLLLGVLFAVCPIAARANGAEVIPPGLPRPHAAATPEAGMRQLAAGNRAFALQLYQQLSRQEGNLFYSPYSISVALGMTYAGARGATERQMARAMNFYLPSDELAAAFASLDQTLATRGQGARGTKGQPFRLNIANALWGQTGERFLPSYLDLLQRNYGAGVQQVNFAQPEAARGTINDWVSRETQQKITDLIAPGVLTPTTRLVLTNAIYFNAAWDHPFEKANTKPGPFTLLNGRKITADMMHGNLSAGYAAGDDWQAVDLPYQGRQLSMTLLLPAAGRFKSLERALTAAQVEVICTYLRPTELALTMPKFKYESTFSLGRTLAALGMREAFTPRADFSGMNGRRDLFIGEVVHKALVEVDEEGTEAAAATAVVMRTTALPPSRRIEVVIDRPFLFVIRDAPTGVVLFVGRVVEPKG